MLRPHLCVVPIALVALLSGCGGEAPPIDSAKDTLRFETGEFEIPAGDSFTCFYTDTFTDKELSVVTATGLQGPGGHHILAYWTDVEREPGYHPCKDSEMVDWHQIAGSGGQDKVGEGVIGLPDGLAIRVPPGKQLVLQAHYINTTGEPAKVNDTVTLHTVDPAEVKAYANYFVVIDDSFEVPPQSKYTSVQYCTVDRDLQTVLSLGHMHEWGTQYTLEIVDPDDKVLSLIRSDEWRPEFTSHPPITRQTLDAPFMLKKGMRLRQTCSWDNTTADPLLFPHEMCVGFFYYYPDAGELVCETAP